MKKFFYPLLILAIAGLAACGSGDDEQEKTPDPPQPVVSESDKFLGFWQLQGSENGLVFNKDGTYMEWSCYTYLHYKEAFLKTGYWMYDEKNKEMTNTLASYKWKINFFRDDTFSATNVSEDPYTTTWQRNEYLHFSFNLCTEWKSPTHSFRFPSVVGRDSKPLEIQYSWHGDYDELLPNPDWYYGYPQKKVWVSYRSSENGQMIADVIISMLDTGGDEQWHNIFKGTFTITNPDTPDAKLTIAGEIDPTNHFGHKKSHSATYTRVKYDD